jgi:bifunctional UDP-N-acetylglucosamine pyrophosphorylase/glucosamine-1-phosphate N-acetyltransferase
VDVRPGCYDKIVDLLEKGVDIPNPLSLDIGPDVDLARISGEGVKIFPGCRIYGSGTVISAGSVLGAEGPVTIDDCRLGPSVKLKGGYFSGSVFLEKANMGLGAQVREGTLLEEEAGGAHCVGLKQTILFPFVTLGSLINFCDCLMAGGTSRKDHSEVGSSYIHFNFTPDGDKTTASLFGDVPRGVMLGQRPIFLGGQGGTVGPVQTGFGTVVAAGSILRDDVPDDGMLVTTGALGRARRPVAPHSYRGLRRVLERNVTYLASLVALEQWYEGVRKPFFEEQEFGPLVFEGALDILARARAERAKRLVAMAAKVTDDSEPRALFRRRARELVTVFDSPQVRSGSDFLTAFRASVTRPTDYVTAVQTLPGEVAEAGVHWLQSIIDDLCARAASIVPSMNLFAAS